jgi:hypothetical protein
MTPRRLRPLAPSSLVLTLLAVLPACGDSDDAGLGGNTETQGASGTSAATATAGSGESAATATSGSASTTTSASGTSGTSDSTATSSTSTSSTSSTSASTDPTATGTSGVDCPDNPCTAADAGADGYCADDSTRIACVAGPDGCLVPGESSTCEQRCLLGTCCVESSFDEGVQCDCLSNECLDNGLGEGWHCLPDGRETTCSEFNCIKPTTGFPRECDPGITCDPATGTCGGCDPNSECFGREGRTVCASAPGINQATCAVVDGCSVETDVRDCARACVSGTGCCGTAGEPCCRGMTPSCFDGLVCVADVCTAP